MARHKLTKAQTALCKKCRHGAAAHKGGLLHEKCHMKHCKCKGFEGTGGLFG